MSRALRAAGILLVVLVGLGVLAVAAVFLASNARMNKTYDIQPAAVPIPTDEESLALGKDTADFYCTGCHGDDLAGQIISRSLLDGTDAPPNLTAGQGGIGAAYSDEDWARAIRHGVAPDGSPLLGMPSDRFADLDDWQFGALVAYVKSVPPVDNALPDNTLGLLPRFNFLIGRDPLLAADLLNHETLLRPPGEIYLAPAGEESGGE